MVTDPVVQEREQDVLVVLHGDVDRSAAPALLEALGRAVGARRPLVLVDMTDVDFVDRAGLSIFATVRRQLAEGQRLALCNVPDRIQRILRVTAFDQLFEVHAACGRGLTSRRSG